MNIRDRLHALELRLASRVTRSELRDVNKFIRPMGETPYTYDELVALGANEHQIVLCHQLALMEASIPTGEDGSPEREDQLRILKTFERRSN
ncbi:MAG: hypothetical protein GX621_12850 [Pirellulaceae bacterium]|nr:hypothetical protein [Pirellulaceae bacterium]